MAQINVRVPESLKKRFKAEVGGGSMSDEIKRFMQARIDSDLDMDSKEEIQAKIERLRNRKEQVKEEKEEKADKLSELEQKIDSLHAQLEANEMRKEEEMEEWIEVNR